MVTSFSAYRPRGGQPFPEPRELRQETIFPFPCLPLDLRSWPDQHPLPERLLAAIAPLNAVYRHPKQALAARQKLLDDFPGPGVDSGHFSSIFAGQSCSAPRNDRRGTRVLRPGAPGPRLPADLLTLSLPLQVLAWQQDGALAEEHYRLQYYVYDPLTARWYLVRSWPVSRSRPEQRQHRLVAVKNYYARQPLPPAPSGYQAWAADDFNHRIRQLSEEQLFSRC